MNKLNAEDILDRTANFLEQLVLDKFNVTDEHEFLVLATYFKNTDFYESQKDKINLGEYIDMRDVYTDMVYKVTKTPFLTSYILAGLFPVLFDVWERDTKNAKEN